MWELVPKAVLAFDFKFLGCLEAAKHDIFVLTVDCSVKNGRGRLSSCLWLGDPASCRRCGRERAPLPGELRVPRLQQLPLSLAVSPQWKNVSACLWRPSFKPSWNVGDGTWLLGRKRGQHSYCADCSDVTPVQGGGGRRAVWFPRMKRNETRCVWFVRRRTRSRAAGVSSPRGVCRSTWTDTSAKGITCNPTERLCEVVREPLVECSDCDVLFMCGRDEGKYLYRVSKA